VVSTRNSESREESQPRNRFLLLAVTLSYVVATGLGVIMRFELLGFGTGVEFDHLLHAHSHTLYFGWAGLGILILAIGLLPTWSAAHLRTAMFLALLLPGILFGFLAFGYNPVTIAISTLVMLGWYLAAWQWWRDARALTRLEFKFLRAGFGYLLGSSLGIWTLAFLQASETGTELSETLAIHAFLLGFAWFIVLSVVGLIVAHAPRLDLKLDEAALRRALFWWIPLAIVTFPLGVVGGPEVDWLGPVARVAGIALLYPAWLFARSLWTGAAANTLRASWRMVATWFGGAALATAAAGVFGSEILRAAGRQGVVIYLHVLLVGFVSASLFTLLTEVDLQRTLKAHHLSLGLMILGLIAVALGWMDTGYWLAALGAVGLWLTGLGWARGESLR
jgi:hypothetical protein